MSAHEEHDHRYEQTVESSTAALHSQHQQQHPLPQQHSQRTLANYPQQTTSTTMNRGSSTTGAATDANIATGESTENTNTTSATNPNTTTNAGPAVATTNTTGTGDTTRRARQPISYAAERVIGNGSFGVVYQATVLETQETVAIKKVLQDRRFKNRELQIMSSLNHPNVVALKHCFFSRSERDDVFLNLVMEYIPETLHRTLRVHTRARRLIPALHTKCYIYQLCRSLAYIHSLGVCHRDIKPQNLLLNARTHELKLCDFGSAKVLVPGELNVSYICSRYYRAPELVFEAVEYTTAVDIWSLGCVFAELLLGTPLFPGNSGIGQLNEIIQVLGTPTREEIYAMNPDHRAYRFQQVTPHNWTRIFRDRAPPDAVDLVSQFLRYTPTERLHPMDALAHSYFDELRDPSVRLLNGRLLPNIHNWLDSELQMMRVRGLANTLIPPHIAAQLTPEGRMPSTLVLDPANPHTTTVALGPNGSVTHLQTNPDGTLAPLPPPAPATTSPADVLAHSNPAQVPLASISNPQGAPVAVAAVAEGAPLPVSLPQQQQQHVTTHTTTTTGGVPLPVQQQSSSYGIGRPAGSDRMHDSSHGHYNNTTTRSER